jgi:BirA family transcriptional regulator, biotin operon repressor / biotin---[acetyl-CoA-carboxylase] ligase
MALPMTTDWRAAERPLARVGRAIEPHDRIGSTSDRARELLDSGAEGVAVVAEEQTNGRGRRGRTWSSPAGTNLLVSVGLRPRLAADAAWALGPAAALAVRSACEVIAPVALKWPNDVVDGEGRKLGGILVETAIEADRVRHAVLGFGINVNWEWSAMPAELRSTATSLREVRGRLIDRVGLLRCLLDALDVELEAIEHGRSPLGRYAEACTTIGARVRVETPNGPLDGTAIGLDERGELMLRTAAGVTVVASGEVVRLRPAAPA